MNTDELDQTLNNLIQYSYDYGAGKISPIGNDPPLIKARLAKQAIQALIAKECNKARIDEIKRYREAMTFAHITPSIYAAERIPELLSEEQK